MTTTARRLAPTTRREVRRLDPGPGRDATPRPFLKWVGGKGQLLDRIFPRLPERFGGYHEPFLGGGAVFFGLSREQALVKRRVTLSDVNAELIATYTAIRDEVEAVITALGVHEYEESHYYAVRAMDPWAMSAAERAARMIYLNRSGFNGLYRVNRAGQFNVPFGRYTNPRLCDEENLRAVSRALADAEITHAPFAEVAERAERGDLVYFDPPYVPVSRTASFVSYARDGFSERDQEVLAALVESLVARGVHVVLSNSDTPWVRERYRALEVLRVPARRNINSNGERRGPVGEVLVLG